MYTIHAGSNFIVKWFKIFEPLVIMIYFILNMIWVFETEVPEYRLKTVEITAYRYDYLSDITKADSVLALAMLLNRECPDCSILERQYLASTVITGAKEENCSWKEYLFNKGQFWGLNDKRIVYDPSNPNHNKNLWAARYAWETPKPVRFYTSKSDTKSHQKFVYKRKGFRPRGFYHTYSK